MSLRRSVGFLFTRRFSPRATPWTAPARSLHTSLKDFPIPDGIGRAAGVAATALASAGALALQYFRKDPAEDQQGRQFLNEQAKQIIVSNMSGTTTSYLFSCAAAPPMKEEDLKARFEDWTKKYSKTYRDEEEKAMRFQVFKETIERIESLPPDLRDMLRPLNCFADTRFEEFHGQSCIVEIDDPETREYNKKLDEWLARKDKGERFIWPPVQQGNKKATQVSA